jgi:DNA-binding GntR family transcriptional regulator
MSDSGSDPLAELLLPPDQRALADDVVGRLRRTILEGYVAPGERLREEQLASLLQVSRGPVREALLQLEREGLVLRRRNRGAIVARLSRHDLEEVFSLRLALERLALQWAARKATYAECARMEGLIRRQGEELTGDVSRRFAAQLDLEFHDLVYESARHRRLARSWHDLRPQVYVFLLSRDYVGTPEFPAIMVRNHRLYLDVIRARDERRAAQVAEDHVGTSYGRVVSGYPAERAEETARGRGRRVDGQATDHRHE